MTKDEVVLLAHMIGDGSCVKNQPVAVVWSATFTTAPNNAWSH
jgi:hypothetical protein